MTKEQSQIIKGISILMMIYYHLFDAYFVNEYCYVHFYVFNIPLVNFIQRATNPVPFFLIIGGYGLYKVWVKGDKNKYYRILKLYIHYWIIVFIFGSIGSLILPSKYPGNIIILIENLTSFNPTYNHTMWFLLPYAFLSIGAPLLFKMLKSIKWYFIILTTLGLEIITSYLISRYGEVYLFNHMWVYNPLLVIHLLFNFSIGYCCARDDFFGILKKNLRKWSTVKRNALGLLSILILTLIQSCFKYNVFFAFFIISCISILSFKGFCKFALINLGNQSMNMWMIHGWFCYCLFTSWVFSFRFPILIFLILIFVSFGSSLLINLISRPIEKLFLTKKEISEKPIL